MTRRISALFLLAPAVVLPFVGCASSPPPKPAGGSAVCAERVEKAQAEIQPTLVSEGCATDADCVVVGFASRCFDSCARVTVASKLQAFHDAVAKVNQGICKDFENDGCKRTVPPCMPPPPVRCEKTRCVM